MQVRVRTLRRLGRNLPQQERNSLPPFVGVLSIDEARDPELGRAVVRARLVDQLQGFELLPELADAQVLWLEGSKLRLAGMERIENASYAQTWSIEVA